MFFTHYFLRHQAVQFQKSCFPLFLLPCTDSVEGRCSLQAYECLALHKWTPISKLHSLSQWLVSGVFVLPDNHLSVLCDLISGSYLRVPALHPTLAISALTWPSLLLGHQLLDFPLLFLFFYFGLFVNLLNSFWALICSSGHPITLWKKKIRLSFK